MRSTRVLPLALVLLAGCTAAPTPPAAPKAAEPDRLKVSSAMQLHDDKATSIKLIDIRKGVVEIPVGSKAKVLEDVYMITADPGARLIHVIVEDGPLAGTVGHVSRSDLRPMPGS